LWDTGQQLDAHLERIYRMRFPEDLEGLYDFLIFVEAIQLEMGSYWIGELQKVVPKLIKECHRQARKDKRKDNKVPTSAKTALSRRASPRSGRKNVQPTA
jgi:hypothetical protein